MSVFDSMDKKRVLFEEDFETWDEYKEYVEKDLKDDVLDFMSIYRIGIGSSFFATILRKVADYVDD